MKKFILLALLLSYPVAAQEIQLPTDAIERATVRNLVLEERCGLTATENQRRGLSMIVESEEIERQAERLSARLITDCSLAVVYVDMTFVMPRAEQTGALMVAPAMQNAIRDNNNLMERALKDYLGAIEEFSR